MKKYFYSVLLSAFLPYILNVRGKIGPFGRTQNWNALDVSSLPMELQSLDVSTWAPVINK